IAQCPFQDGRRGARWSSPFSMGIGQWAICPCCSSVGTIWPSSSPGLRVRLIPLLSALAFLSVSPSVRQSVHAQGVDSTRLAALKREAAAEVDRMATFTQQAVDMVFSFGELGFQEIETSKYLTGLLRKNGFTV